MIDQENQGGQAVIPGMPRLAWGTSRECTFAGALEAALAVTDHPCSYADLMGLSGLAFRVRWSNDETQPQWCGSCAIGEMPEEYQALVQLTGWSLPTEVQFASQPADARPDKGTIRDRVVASIDAGRPVLAYASTPDMAVVYGYEGGGQTLLISDYSQPEQPFRLVSDKLGPMQTYLGEYSSPPSRRDALIAALQTAVQNWRRLRHDGGIAGRDYWYGEAAFRAWCKDLEGFDALSAETRERLFGLDGWNLVSVHDARQAVVTFLSAHASDVNGVARPALERAAGQYQRAIQALEPVLAERQAVTNVASWSQEARQREVDALEQVQQLESKAVADLDLALTAALAPTNGEMVILKGVDRYRVMDPLFECVRVVLSCLGETYSPAYVQGLSGAAFRIGGICPCAPTCSLAMEPWELITLLGYEVEFLPLSEEGTDRQRVYEVLARVRDEIRAGRPAILWHAFTNCEWDVVCGFDDQAKLFLGRGSYAGREDYARADQLRTITCTDTCPALGAVLIGDKTGQLDVRQAELAALREAVRHARSRKGQEELNGGKWVFLEGLQCYDRWVTDFISPEKKRGSGDAYCLGVYRSTHRAASEFMLELVPRYPEATAHFERAAGHFAAEADALDQCVPLLGWESPPGPDAERNARAAVLLRQARDCYARGIDEIEGALRILGE